jgi:long-chain fatty acid transport protein
VTNEGDPEFSGLTPQRQQLLDSYGVLNKDISFDTSIPQAVLVGVFHDFQNRWSFSLDALWMDFSKWGVENVEIGDTEIAKKDGNYKDIWGLALGVNYELHPLWTVRSGAFYVSSVLDKKDRTAFMRLDEMWGVGFGFEYKYREKRSVGFDLTYIQLGDGKFTAEDVPGVGNIRGEYTKNYAVMFGISTKW